MATDVDASLSERRSLVVTWLNRGTLHLVAAEDYWWLHPLTAPRVTGQNDRRLRQLGVDGARTERGIEVIMGALRRHGPQTRDAPAVVLAAAGVATGLAPPPRLLGAFDPLLHGWRSRAMFVGAHRDVVTVNGIFRPVVLVGGRAVATWKLPGGVVTVDPLERLSAAVRVAVAEDGKDVLRFLGLEDRPVAFTSSGY